MELKLISREGSGRSVRYTLLNESGGGQAYTRPRSAAEGAWFSLPHGFWLDGHEQRLELAEKVMLLIAMSSKAGFELPASRAPGWYGVSESTASRGLRGLEQKGYLIVGEHYVPDARSKTMWRTVKSYTLVEPWSAASRRAAMKTRRTPAFRVRPAGQATSPEPTENGAASAAPTI